MLLDKTLDLEKCGQKVPFIPGGIDGIRQRLVAVEGFENRVERISVVVRIERGIIFFWLIGLLVLLLLSLSGCR